MSSETEQEPLDASVATEIQPRQLIVTIFGLYARAESNWLSVASVVKLMAELDIDGPAVRSSISRLKRRDVLLSSRFDGAAGYSLSQRSLDVVNEGDTRIFDRRRATLDDGWLLVVFSVPESEREKRHSLRSALTTLGFGTAAPGVWIAPGNLERETRDTLDKRTLSAYVDIFRSEHLAYGDLRSKVRSWWNLNELSELYGDFVRRYRSVSSALDANGVTASVAFEQYVPMLTEWRRLPYLDPGLPLTLLPQGWTGVTAEALFADLNSRLSGPAREHALSVIHR
ncbi:PaaX family transcriptional regulator [Rhodococcoides yunnanense]|uniref:PaaX family transcriptional regulator n=1 Tax=Rhodococcoides yunnanense TaxID=278209 RepID=UPI000933B01F|nr:PaaX family transcriptional regulator C-terminal domain-containing protein [Rhodococcus yunnanensis]